MDLIQSSLFLGFPICPLFREALQKNKTEVLSFFIHPGGDYLQEIQYEGMNYLGKVIENTSTIQQISLLEEHIYSLLKKLVADYPYQKEFLYLFPIPFNETIKCDQS